MKEELFKQATETVVLHNFISAFEEGCTRCTLSDKSHKPIIYRGNPKADILLVGEAPGKVEQEEGKPFVGPAGQLLDSIMDSVGFNTETDMCITNSVYCRPTAPADSGKQNYTPKEDQLFLCEPLVKNFIYTIRPKVIIACGRIALVQLTGNSKIKIGEHEGQWRYISWLPNKDKSIEGTPMFVMTHPAAILHKANYPDEQLEMKKRVWEYMKIFRDTWKEKAGIK